MQRHAGHGRCEAEQCDVVVKRLRQVPRVANDRDSPSLGTPNHRKVGQSRDHVEGGIGNDRSELVCHAMGRGQHPLGVDQCPTAKCADTDARRGVVHQCHNRRPRPRGCIAATDNAGRGVRVIRPSAGQHSREHHPKGRTDPEHPVPHAKHGTRRKRACKLPERLGLGLEPRRTYTKVDLEGRVEGVGADHGVANDRGNLLGLAGRDLDQKFVMDLKHDA